MAPYYKLHQLGSGSYGKVWVVRTPDSKKELKVLKEIRLHGLQDRDIKQASIEVEILSRCRHKNIIAYTEAFLCENRILCIVMEYASGGDVHQQIAQRRGLYFPNETVQKWFFQLLSALKYIHSRGILHRDIKPQNLFLTDRRNIKLGDFGISRILQSDSDVALTLIGTPFYLSPEICNQQPYSFKSDMWSAGCVLYELCCLRVPFTGSDLPSLASEIQQGSYSPLPGHCDEMFHDLVNSLLKSDPEKRPSASDILQNAVMQGCFKGMSSSNTQNDKSAVFSHHIREKASSEMGEIPHVSAGNEMADETGHLSRRDLQNLARKIDSSTYTVVKHPNVRRLSLASPELSALIEKQRSQSLETQQALSADAPRKPKSRNQVKVSPPCLNLLKAMQSKHDDKTKTCEGAGINPTITEQKITGGPMEKLTEIVYEYFLYDSSHEEAAEKILSLLHSAMRPSRTAAVLAAVMNKMALGDLLINFDIQLPIVHCVLWYLKFVKNYQ